jgi:hypothetical protein
MSGSKPHLVLEEWEAALELEVALEMAEPEMENPDTKCLHKNHKCLQHCNTLLGCCTKLASTHTLSNSIDHQLLHQ